MVEVVEGGAEVGPKPNAPGVHVVSVMSICHTPGSLPASRSHTFAWIGRWTRCTPYISVYQVVPSSAAVMAYESSGGVP